MSRALLHGRFTSLAHSLPHLPLGKAPTPVRELTGLTAAVPVWCKDESVYGSGGWGGNKVRKLEWILPDMHRKGAGTLLTVGGLGTNWGLAAALYGQEQGFSTAIALIDQPIDDHVRAQLVRLRQSGATLHYTRTKRRTIAAAPWLFLRHISGGTLPYFLPAGGSSPVGTLGYVEAALELAEQVAAGELPEPSHVVTAVGSGGTAAGLALGLRLAGLQSRVVGVVVNDTLRLNAATVAALAGRTERLLLERGANFPPIGLSADQVTIVREWLGPGYGHATREAEQARSVAATNASLEVEPVYTAKALAALLAMASGGLLDSGPVLFLNTYGPR
ncbi:1-aminocyclopropane-1-carboxylate deaminase/D-cysteine desulfhydrase [Streptomyces sp. NBC_00467]|uniref:1-aminocyclopropane-1-carboxylate deaminase/D-cysteine desulfhydrase n=1 Tax=Streptomyces sp. NBC_00467 TaxID=2975752 RepID=UPI002E177592